MTNADYARELQLYLAKISGIQCEYAVLLVGFNNWGKTTHVKKAFNAKSFRLGVPYAPQGCKTKFAVESHSNDDSPVLKYRWLVARKLANCNTRPLNFFGTLCPTRNGLSLQRNDAADILRMAPFDKFKEIHLLLLQYKWDWHAELRLTEITKHLLTVPNVQLHVVDADRHHHTDSTRKDARALQIETILKGYIP